MGKKTCPACKGSGQSKVGAAHCLACEGTGEIDTPDRPPKRGNRRRPSSSVPDRPRA
jgi:RecJ-like exonuclease